MPSVKKVKKSPKSMFLIIGLLILGGIIMLQTMRRAVGRIANDFFFPFLQAPAKIETAISNKSLLLKSKLALASTIEELRRENDKLTVKIAKTRKFELENQQLRKLVDLKSGTSYNCLIAELILRDPAFWDERFTVNKGSDDGVEAGSIVLSYAHAPEQPDKSILAVIGRVKSVSKHSSIVSTIISKHTRLSVSLPENKAHGIVKGGGRKNNKFWANLTFLPRDLDYKPGSPVYTSGLSNLTPPGLYVGKLSASSDFAPHIQDNLYMQATIRPAVDLENVRFVMLIIRKKEEE
jgi:rod shape-determining protein MreC